MASLRYKKIPEPSLYNLTRDDLVVLDLALAHTKDVENDDPNSILATPAQHAALVHLHMCVLEIKRGETETEK